MENMKKTREYLKFDDQGEVDVKATMSAFDKDRALVKESVESEAARIKGTNENYEKTARKVFADHPDVPFTKPALVFEMLNVLNPSPAAYPQERKRVEDFLSRNPSTFVVARGKGGGVKLAETPQAAE